MISRVRLRRRRTTGVAVLLLGGWFVRRYSQFRPFAVLLARVQRFYPDARSRAEKRVFRAVYGTLNRLLRATDVSFLNYGYASLGEPEPLELGRGSEPDRFAVQLYDKVVGTADLHGLAVLEVGCGRGGGAAFVFERHRPASMTGLD